MILKKLEKMIKYRSTLLDISFSFDYEGDDMMLYEKFVIENKWVKDKIKLLDNKLEIIKNIINSVERK